MRKSFPLICRGTLDNCVGPSSIVLRKIWFRSACASSSADVLVLDRRRTNSSNVRSKDSKVVLLAYVKLFSNPLCRKRTRPLDSRPIRPVLFEWTDVFVGSSYLRFKAIVRHNYERMIEQHCCGLLLARQGLWWNQFLLAAEPIAVENRSREL
mmetsp:Transcript_27035/g.105157  ORF Transcript_27035/g.105157 Transcript_27035/m.105157 type:complete len:153 (-) Transcript_27035:1532-1990(-)